jgi:glycogen debranching enzyme
MPGRPPDAAVARHGSIAPSAPRPGDGEWFVNAAELGGGARHLVLKDNDAFLVCDARGDFSAASSELGYYFKTTRHLSRSELRLGGQLPLVLDAGPSPDDERLQIDLTNGSAWDLGSRRLPSHSIYLFRELAFDEDVLLERLKLHNFDVEPIEVELRLRFDSDFADMFEVRGTPRKERGQVLPPHVDRSSLRLSYRGLDGRRRATVISADPAPLELDPSGFFYRFELGPGADRELRLRIEALQEAPLEHGGPPVLRNTSKGKARALEELGPLPTIRTSDLVLTRILDRAVKDLATMLSSTPQGLYPYAGIPWYCAPFGRDGTWTALQLLPWMPGVARGVLLFQAEMQARDFDDFTDREPGKIFHEYREGEMANLGEIPFVPYYGSADSTPLFLVLLAEYVRTTGDRGLLERLWPNALRALEWMQVHGDLDGDGFVEYRCRSRIGLRNQCWKDSFDGITHADGRLAEPPIAAVEIQGYVYRALLGSAWLAELHGQPELAVELATRARALFERIHAAFWLPEEGYYALALDRDKRACRVLTTNPGHLLWAGAVAHDPGHATALRLTGSDLSSGFGLRTLAKSAARYNPLSYHNGSVWPHDNAIVADGLRRYGHLDGAFQVFEGVVRALAGSGDLRVPELYCGFQRVRDERMTPYPVACAPQAWSSGAMLAFARMLLGLSVDARQRLVRFDDPVLPPWLDWMEVRNLPVPGGRMDFLSIRGRVSCSIEILQKSPDVRVHVQM